MNLQLLNLWCVVLPNPFIVLSTVNHGINFYLLNSLWLNNKEKQTCISPLRFHQNFSVTNVITIMLSHNQVKYMRTCGPSTGKTRTKICRPYVRMCGQNADHNFADQKSWNHFLRRVHLKEMFTFLTKVVWSFINNLQCDAVGEVAGRASVM